MQVISKLHASVARLDEFRVLSSRVLRYAFAVAYRRFQYVNVLFPVIVVPGRVELPTSTLSV